MPILVSAFIINRAKYFVLSRAFSDIFERTRTLNDYLFSIPLIMASDEIVWSVINQQFCSFKLK